MRAMRIGLLVLALLAQAAGLAAGEIHDAIRRSDKAAVERLVAADPSVLRLKDTDGSPPLLTAAFAGNVELASLLLEKGAELLLGDNENSNALHLAACGGSLAMIDMLIARGIDVNSADANGLTAVLFAGSRGRFDVASHLASKGGKLDHRSNGGSTLVHYAANRGTIDVLKELASKGVPLSPGPDQWGNTPLAAAAMRGRNEAAAFLLENGADVNETGADGQTALVAAVSGGHRGIVELLLSRGADPNIEWHGGNALAFASWSDDPEITRLLIEHGADAKDVDEAGSNALHRLAYRGGVEAARLLVEAGCDPNLANNEGMTPMLRAAERGHRDLVEYLVSAGARTDAAEGAFGSTALHIAAAKGYGDIAGFLVEKGAPLDAKDRFGKTPLHYAVRHGNRGIADAIRARGGKGAPKETAAADLLAKKLGEGEAVVYFTGHSGWVVQTKNHVMIFDFFQDGRVSDSPGLLNGCIRPAELRGKNVTAFVSHTVHRDHYSKANFGWNRGLDRISWVFGQAPDTSVACELIEPRQTKNIDGIEVTAIRSTDAGVGFLVTVDGITFLHSGDHHNRDANVDGPFAAEIEYLAGLGRKIDFAFFPVSGCGFGDQEIVKKGVYYAVDRLGPDFVFPMHGTCSRFFDFAAAAKSAGCTVPLGLPKTGGDRFIYKSGKLAEL